MKRLAFTFAALLMSFAVGARAHGINFDPGTAAQCTEPQIRSLQNLIQDLSRVSMTVMDYMGSDDSTKEGLEAVTGRALGQIKQGFKSYADQYGEQPCTYQHGGAVYLVDPSTLGTAIRDLDGKVSAPPVPEPETPACPDPVQADWKATQSRLEPAVASMMRYAARLTTARSRGQDASRESEVFRASAKNVVSIYRSFRDAHPGDLVCGIYENGTFQYTINLPEKDAELAAAAKSLDTPQ